MKLQRKYIAKIIIFIFLLISLALVIWRLFDPTSHALRSWTGCKSRPYSETGWDKNGNWCKPSFESVKIYKPQNTPEESTEPLKLTNISTDQTIASPLTIKGQAPGSWFFEGSFPVKITDSIGNILGSSTAQSTENWMADKLINFTATIIFESANDKQGFVIFSKDNPSGLPENAKSIKLPIKF